MLPEEVDIVIYHAPCPDGFGSALSAYMYFKNKNGVNKKLQKPSFKLYSTVAVRLPHIGVLNFDV